MSYDLKRTGAIRNLYLGISLFLILFGWIYEMFSHGVYSGFMMFAFTLPLLFVVLPYAILHRMLKGKKNLRLSESAGAIYRSAILTATLGSLFNGVLKIYGTTNSLITVYIIAVPILLLLAFFAAKSTARNNNQKIQNK